MDILCSKEFRPFLNKTNSIKTIAKIISKKEQNELKKDSESVRPVHKLWRELLNPFSWIPSKGDSYSGVRKRATKEPVEFPITLGFVIAWIGVLILHGAMGGKLNYWRQMPYGRGYQPIQNTMNRDAFNFMHRYIHLRTM